MSDRSYPEIEINEAIIAVYNGALAAHQEGTISYNECVGAKSALVALMDVLAIEYRFEAQNGREQSASIEQVDDPPTFTPRPDTDGPALGR